VFEVQGEQMSPCRKKKRRSRAADERRAVRDSCVRQPLDQGGGPAVNSTKPKMN
jgi:hypothetical protein